MQALLESKWPTSETNAYQLWRKLRNLIMAVAQFRHSIRRRSISLYSNSESDFDGISHASVDSFIEEQSNPDGNTSTKTEFVSDLVPVESPNNEERKSTGTICDHRREREILSPVHTVLVSIFVH